MSSPTKLTSAVLSDRRTSGKAAVAIIGSRTQALFFELIDFLQRSSDVRIVGQYDTISDSLQQGLGQSVAADFVVVLQTFSDEYSQTEAGLLIGQMLFGRVFCCYGPWCPSDGRSHEVWPVSVRVPIHSAVPIIMQELGAFQNGEAPLSPMSAAEEVFYHRYREDSTPSSFDERSCVIVSDELPLRRTARQMCQNLGWRIEECSRSISEIDATLAKLGTMSRTALKSKASKSQITILLDLDPLDESCRSTLRWLQEKHSSCDTHGLTVFSESAFSLKGVASVIEKTELLTRLSQLSKTR